MGVGLEDNRKTYKQPMIVCLSILKKKLFLDILTKFLISSFRLWILWVTTVIGANAGSLQNSSLSKTDIREEIRIGDETLAMEDSNAVHYLSLLHPPSNELFLEC